MYADWSDYSDEIKVKLEELNSRSIPLLVIYPGSQPDQPIILRDIVTQSQVIDALRAAGASVDRKALNDLPRLQSVASSLAPTVPSEMGETNRVAEPDIKDFQDSQTVTGAVMMLGAQL